MESNFASGLNVISLNPSIPPMNPERWNFYTRNSDRAEVRGVQFTGTNSEEIAKATGVAFEDDLFATGEHGLRYRQGSDSPPQFLMLTDWLVWEDGRAFTWNAKSFQSSFTPGKPNGKKLGSKDYQG